MVMLMVGGVIGILMEMRGGCKVVVEGEEGGLGTSFLKWIFGGGGVIVGSCILGLECSYVDIRIVPIRNVTCR